MILKNLIFNRKHKNARTCWNLKMRHLERKTASTIVLKNLIPEIQGIFVGYTYLSCPFLP